MKLHSQKCIVCNKPRVVVTVVRLHHAKIISGFTKMVSLKWLLLKAYLQRNLFNLHIS